MQRNNKLHLEQRHLGLKSATEEIIGEPYLKELLEHTQKSLSNESLLKYLQLKGLKRKEVKAPKTESSENGAKKAIIAVAFDDAFHFYYKANFEALEKAGAMLKFFSPLYDPALPSDATALYIGGGYPELFANRLSQNALMKQSIRQFAEKGYPVYAECGGLIYLSRTVENISKQSFEMCGILPFSCRMLHRRKILGYVSVRLTDDTFLATKGSSFRGHEFHYSEIVEGTDKEVTTVYELEKRRGGDIRKEGYLSQNVLASYVHAYFPSNHAIAEGFVRTAAEIREQNECQQSKQL